MATSLSLENDPSLAQGYLKVNGSTAATLTTSGITGNLTGNLTGNVTGNLTGTASALQSRVKFPNFSSPTTITYNTVNQATTDGFLCINVTGSFKNGIQLFVGSTTSPNIAIWMKGDDLNSNTKTASSGLVPIPANTYYLVAPLSPYDAFEVIQIIWYPAI
jgi:hypothetical protein